MTREQLLSRISIDPQVCFGKPCIRGHRIWVSLILDLLAEGMTPQQVLTEYPGLVEPDIQACIAYGVEKGLEGVSALDATARCGNPGPEGASVNSQGRQPLGSGLCGDEALQGRARTMATGIGCACRYYSEDDDGDQPMECMLFYRGLLKSKGDPKHKHELREAFHEQLAQLWQRPPLDDCRDLLGEGDHDPEQCVIETVGGFRFAPLVTAKRDQKAELRITLLRPDDPGTIIAAGGDIDNRLKTLFDSLQVPDRNGLPRGAAPKPDQAPFFCLLQDDNLITAVSVATERLLLPGAKPADVVLLIHARVIDTDEIF